MYHGFQLVHQIKWTTTKKLFLILSSLEEKIEFKVLKRRDEKPTTTSNIPDLRDTSFLLAVYTFHIILLTKLNSLKTLLNFMPVSLMMTTMAKTGEFVCRLRLRQCYGRDQPITFSDHRVGISVTQNATSDDC